MQSFKAAAALCALLALTAAGVARAGTLWAGLGGFSNDSPTAGSLIVIDPMTGAGTLIGATGFDEIGDLAFDDAGTLWGMTGNSNGELVADLITIDLASGTGISVGEVGTTFVGLEFDGSGTLFATRFANPSDSGDLYTVSTSDGAPTFVATIDGCSGNNWVTSLARSPGGVMYGSRGGAGTVENLATLNTSSAACTAVGDGSDNRITGVAFDPDTGILYGVGNNGSNNAGVLFQIDPVTGEETVIGPIGFNFVKSLAIQSETTCEGPFDIDGNGAEQALSDALLLLRYLFGLRGDALVSGAVGAGCTRCDATAIEARIALCR